MDTFRNWMKQLGWLIGVSERLLCGEGTDSSELRVDVKPLSVCVGLHLEPSVMVSRSSSETRAPV